MNPHLQTPLSHLLGVQISEARNHWKMLRRRNAKPWKIATARQRIIALVHDLQTTRRQG